MKPIVDVYQMPRKKVPMEGEERGKENQYLEIIINQLSLNNLK